MKTRCLLVAGLACLAGCNDNGLDFAPVSGIVLLDGKPVSGARVVFMPQATGPDFVAGPYSNGETDSEGRYDLKSVETDPTRGAVVGTHRIVISTKKSHLDPQNPDIEIIDSPETIPALYTNYKKTPLSYEVPPDGSDAANFELDSQTGQSGQGRR